LYFGCEAANIFIYLIALGKIHVKKKNRKKALLIAQRGLELTYHNSLDFACSLVSRT
jgi:hypothetical protein